MELKDNLISRSYLLEQIKKKIDETNDIKEIFQLEYFLNLVRNCPNILSIKRANEISNEKYDPDKKAVYFVVNKDQYEKISDVKYEDEEFVPTVIITGVELYEQKTNCKICGSLVLQVNNIPVSLTYESIEKIDCSDGNCMFKISIPDYETKK